MGERRGGRGKGEERGEHAWLLLRLDALVGATHKHVARDLRHEHGDGGSWGLVARERPLLQ